MLYQEQDAADDRDDGRCRHSDLKQASDQLFDVVVRQCDAVAHSSPVKPLYNMFSAARTTTSVKICRRRVVSVFVSNRAPSIAPPSTPSMTGNASVGTM